MYLEEQTSPPIASVASKGLRTGKLTSDEIRSVCAAALVHAKECFHASEPFPTAHEVIARAREILNDAELSESLGIVDEEPSAEGA